MIHFVCEENKSNVDNERFFMLRSRGISNEGIWTIFFGIQYRFDFDNGGNISPNSDVIWSIIDSFRSESFINDGGV